jgi:hypothetical protein
VGPPIDDDGDQRLEYRQALRDLLAELSPSAWPPVVAEADGRADEVPVKVVDSSGDEHLGSIQAQLAERLNGVMFPPAASENLVVFGPVTARCRVKIAYLDTALLLITADGIAKRGNADVASLADACLQLAAHDPDVNAVVVADPRGSWPSQLFPMANLREAFSAPGGGRTGPEPTLDGHGAVDTICKYFEGVISPWDIVETPSSLVGETDVKAVVTRHAANARVEIGLEGQRAKQVAKKEGYAGLSASFDEDLARFVAAVINQADVDSAMSELLEVTDDD